MQNYVLAKIIKLMARVASVRNEAYTLQSVFDVGTRDMFIDDDGYLNIRTKLL